MSRLKDLYKNTIVPEFIKVHGYKNIFAVPRLQKIVLNMGIGGAVSDGKLLKNAAEELALIAGQKHIITKARKSIAGFKLREGLEIGAKVTLRHEKMYEFLDRLINIALPRVRDFRGLSVKAFDGLGNYSLGIRESIVFPELSGRALDHINGLDVTLVTSANDNKGGYQLLKAFNFPFYDKVD